MRRTGLRGRFAALFGAAAVAACSVFGGPAAEEPVYRVIETDGAFEIREYPPIVVARTAVAAESRGVAVREGFGRLFDYISGENLGARDGAGDGGAKIEMTAPVIVQQQAEGQKIDMTAPVLVTPGEGVWETAFVLPEGYTLATAPLPASPDVTLAEIPGRRGAVVRFSGSFGAENVAEHERLLAEWVDARALAHRGDWQSAGYNPPWTIPALRRNEVLVTLE
jgi:hypothetical protein